MNPMTKYIKLIVGCALALCIAGCASNKPAGWEPNQARAPKPIDHPKPPDHAKTATVHFPLAAAHTSAENSLTWTLGTTAFQYPPAGYGLTSTA